MEIERRVRWYQRPFHEFLVNGGKRAIEIAHRRWGKDEITLSATCELAHKRIGSYWHCLPEYAQARKALWTAVNPHTGRRRIADIMRGSSDPNETLGAQQLKAQFGSQRMKKRQRAVQKWIRDTYKLKAEILAEHFEPAILAEMTGQEVDDEVMQLLRSDKLRSYRIDIETDSTVFEDAEGEKKATTEMLTAVGGFLQQALPTIQQAPELAPLCFEMLSIGVRTFKKGRELEDSIEQVRQAIDAKLAAPPVPQPVPGEPMPPDGAGAPVSPEEVAMMQATASQQVPQTIQ